MRISPRSSLFHMPEKLTIEQIREAVKSLEGMVEPLPELFAINEMDLARIEASMFIWKEPKQK